MSRKRNHRYQPRLSRIPVTDALVAEFRESMTRCEIGLRLQAPTPDVFNEVAGVLNVIAPLAIPKLGDHHADAIALRSAALAMNAALNRAHDYVRMRPDELECMRRGIEAAMRALPRLDVSAMYLQMQALRRAS